MNRALMMVALAACLLLQGCEDSNTPMDAVHRFLSSAASGDQEALASSLTHDSRLIMSTDSSSTSRGIFYFLKPGSTMNEGQEYDLALDYQRKDEAKVDLRPGKTPTAAFKDPGLPEVIRRNGVPIFVKRHKGEWRVDLMATSNWLAEQVIESSPLPHSAPPAWWPGFPGMPGGPPGPPPPPHL